MATERIISADSHVDIRDDAVLGYLPARHHEAYGAAKLAFLTELLGQKPHKARRRQRADQVMDEGSGPALHGEQPWEAAGRPGAWDPDERLKDMDLDGVDAEVLYCDVVAGAMFYGMPDGGWLEAFTAFNSAALDFASRAPDRLVPVYLVPIADIDEAVKEVQRLANEGARAIQLPLYPIDLGFAGYWDPVYDPLWAAISEIGLPISQHVGINAGLQEVLANDPTPAKGIFQSLPPIYMAEVVGSWIIGGVFERFPGLKVVLVEAGLGWIPYYLERLDTMKVRHGWDQFGMLREKPSTYWYQNMAATFEEDTFGVSVRDRLGVDNLMWATDYPHPDSTWPHSREVLRTHFDGVPLDEARRMIGENAARIYNL